MGLYAQSMTAKDRIQNGNNGSIYRHGRWYMGFQTGAGLLNLSQNGTHSEPTVRYELGLIGGYKVFPWLRAGMSVNGWLIEPYDFKFNQDPEGISISNIYGQIQVFPFKRFNLFFNLAGGYSEYINKHPSARGANGNGGLVGVGYERDAFRRCSMTVELNYGFGRFDDSDFAVNQHYNVLELVLGIKYH